MKYLITGYTGFIGKSIVERLKDHDLLFIDRSWQTDENLPKRIKDFNPNYIIHCAAEIKDRTKTFVSNVLMTNWLLEVTLDIDYNAFINLGSSSEYGKCEDAMTEKNILKPRTMYEATKGASTLLCQGYANDYNKPIATIRPFSVYGIHEPENRLIPTLFRNFKNGIKSKLCLGVHDFIHIDDFIDGIFSVLHSEPEIIKGDIVHYGSGIQYSNLEVFNFIKNLYNYNIDYERIDNVFNKYDSLNWVSDISYAKRKYKFDPKYTLETGLKQIYENKYR
jgi:nucleoside-diphosphate-sugar epimerase